MMMTTSALPSRSAAAMYSIQCLLLLATVLVGCDTNTRAPAPAATRTAEHRLGDATDADTDADTDPPPPPDNPADIVRDAPARCSSGDLVDTCSLCPEEPLSLSVDAQYEIETHPMCLCEPLDFVIPDRLLASQALTDGLEVELIIEDLDEEQTLSCLYGGLGLGNGVADHTLDLLECDGESTSGTVIRTDGLTLAFATPPTPSALPVTISASVGDLGACDSPRTDSDVFGVHTPLATPAVFSSQVEPTLITARFELLDMESPEELDGAPATELIHEVAIRDSGHDLVAVLSPVTELPFEIGLSETLVVAWDGLDQNGDPVPPGTYGVSVWTQLVTDGSGEIDEIESAAGTIFHDAEPPSVDVELTLIGESGPEVVEDEDVFYTHANLAALTITFVDEDLPSTVVVENGGEPVDKGTAPADDPVTITSMVPLSWSAGQDVFNEVRVRVLDAARNPIVVDLTIVRQSGSIGVSDFIQDYREAICAAESRCDLGLLPQPPASCLANARRHQLLNLRQEVIDDLVVDDAVASTCLQAIYTLSCDTLARELDIDGLAGRCEHALVGTAGLGDHCLTSMQCAPGSGCMSVASGCDAECVDRGFSCGTSTCDPDTEYCDPSGPTCVTRKANTAPCPGPLSIDVCRDGLRCLANAHGSGHSCQAGRGPGESCDTGPNPCAPGLSCREASDGAFYCFRSSVETTVDAMCSPPSIRCGQGLFCNEDGLCKPRLGPGAACSSSAGCELHLFCAPDTSTCTAPRANGQTCGQGSHCTSGFCSDSGVCVSDIASGCP